VGREIWAKLTSHPLEGAIRLLRRISETPAPEAVNTVVRGGSVGQIINVASVEAMQMNLGSPAISPKWVVERLRQGWNCFIAATTMLAHSQKPREYEPPSAATVLGMVSEINDVFGVEVSPPLTPMPPRNYVDYFSDRIAAKNPIGGAIFRLGGALCLWWQFKGRHGQEMDQELFAAVDDALTDLGYLVPNSPQRVRNTLEPHRGHIGEDSSAESMMSDVAHAVASRS
jgi:hypothetical protein